MVVVRGSNTCNSSAYKTPIRIPNKNVPKCSLLCAIEFIYPQSESWTLRVTSVENKYINFTVNNDKLARTDVKYNGLGYQLERIEFFVPGIHQVNCVNDDSDQTTSCTPAYDVEMVLYHKALSWTEQNQKWLNISVFVTPMYTYSLSQDFFEQLLRISNTGLGGESQNGNVIEPKSSWSPYQAIPHRKSFYIYKGDMPYKPCLSHSDIVWVIMENTVPMHYNEYETLKQLFLHPETKATLFPYNNGANFTPFDLNGRAVYYNDGSFMQTSSSRDKYYVKCVKKEQRPAQKILSFHESGTDEVGAAADAYDRRGNMYAFYTPMQTFITPVMLSALLTLVLVSVFYLGSSDESGESGEAGEGKVTSSRQIIFLLLMALAYVFMYSMTFVNGWLLQTETFMSLLLGPVIIMFGYWVLKKGRAIESGWGGLVRFIAYLIIVVTILELFLAVILNPLNHLVRFGVDTTYDYYYIENEDSLEPEDWKFYIGYRVGIVSKFNNIMISYRNGKSGEDATNIDTIRGQFIMVKPGDSDTLNEALRTTNPTEKKQRMTRILKAYDSKMKADNRNPLQNFISAAWKVLRRRYTSHGQKESDMVNNFKTNINEVLQYLDTDPISNDCIVCNSSD